MIRKCYKDLGVSKSLEKLMAIYSSEILEQTNQKRRK